MTDINSEETSYLLQENFESDSAANNSLSDKTGRNESSITNERLNLKESFFILLSVSFGTGVLVIPYTVRELGALHFVALLLLGTIFLCFCAQLLSKSVHLLTANLQTPELLRDPYPSVGELACGDVLRKLVILFLYLTAISGCIGFVLLVATILKDLLPIGSGFTHNNTIRIWSAVIVTCITPIMYLGTYSDMKIPTLVALTTSSISFMSIMINCFLARFVYDIKPDHSVIDVHKKKGQFLLSLGTMIFVSMGAAFSVPNIVVISSNPHQLGRPILATYICLFFIYLFGGLVPYYTLGEYVTPSITTTFYEIIRIRKVGFLFKFLTITVQVLMMMHLLMASLLVLNPVYLHMEEYLAVPYGK